MISKEYAKHFKEHLVLSLPVAISQFGHIAVGMADTIKAGQMGKLPLASATVATSIFIPFLMLGIGISYGATSLFAQADGAGDKESIRKIFKHSAVLNFILSLLLFVLLYNCSFVIRLLDQPADVVEAAVEFAEWLAWSILPLMVFQTFKQFAEGLSYTVQAMIISIAANIINVLLIYVFTNGWFGFPEMGLNGIAIATLVARTFMAFAMVALVITDKTFSIYMKRFFEPSFEIKEITKLLWISLPVGLQMVLESGAFGFAAIMMGWLGEDEIAAHQIALNMAAFTFMGATAISASASVKVGNELGRKNKEQLQKAGYSAVILALIYMSMTAILFIVFRFELPKLYIDDTIVISMSSSLLLIAAFFQLADGVQVVGFGALRGMGDVLMPTVAVVIAYYVIGLPIGYWFAFTLKIGIVGVWYGLSIGLFFVALFLFFRFRLKSNSLQF